MHNLAMPLKSKFGLTSTSGLQELESNYQRLSDATNSATKIQPLLMVVVQITPFKIAAHSIIAGCIKTHTIVQSH